MRMLACKQLLSLLLVVLMAHPLPLGAATEATSSPNRAVLGSINAYGTVRVGDVAVPVQGTLFAGDQVKTELGGAVVQYRQGVRIQLGSETVASFSPTQVQLQKGQMSFQARDGEETVIAASTLLLKPTAPNSAANVVLQDRQASIAVTEGAVTVVDPSGVELASLRAGEARLFAEASAALPPAPSSSAPAPQGAMSGRGWVLALAVGVVGASLGTAGILRANSADDRANEANQLATTLQSQNAALQTQLNSLRTQLNTLQLLAQGDQAALRALSNSVAQLVLLQQELSALQVQINQAAAAGDVARLQTLLAQQSALFNRVQAATNDVRQKAQDLQNRTGIGTPTRVSP